MLSKYGAVGVSDSDEFAVGDDVLADADGVGLSTRAGVAADGPILTIDAELDKFECFPCTSV